MKRLLWLKILLVLAALILLLCLTRVGARVTFDAGTVAVDVKVGLFHIRVFPRPEKMDKPPKEKTAKQIEKEKQAQAKKEARKAAKAADKTAKKGEKTKPDFKQIAALVRSAVDELFPPLKRALARIGRGIRIHPLHLDIILGAADDPASAAELYGELNGAIWTVMPALEELMDIPDPYLHLDLNFTASKTALRGEAGLSIRIGTLLAAAFCIGIPAVRWLLWLQKQQKQVKNQQPAAPAAAGKTV